ncbi:MAG: cyclodeaminase/cyclohydrolase family protein [Sporomusaceae bacterium]|jgi:formiminotetrahydrofolate cyclodeaminase|nr:cyclodeaminase/cyclohydrolase family protein [Sporomusaceae bacterium]
MFKNLSISEFTDKLSDAKTCVGGGSAAAVTGLLAVGLLKMAAAHSLQSDSFSNSKQLLAAKNNRLLYLEAELANLLNADAAALAKLIACAALEAKDESGVSGEMAQSLENAARIPLQTAAYCQEVLAIALSLLPLVEPNLKSELMSAIVNAHAGAAGALMSVAVNLGYIEDKELIAELKTALQNTKSAIDGLKRQGEDLIFASYPFSVFVS